MNIVIFKHRIQVSGCELEEFTLELPFGARVLHVGLQREIPCMWILQDTDTVRVMRKFVIVGTGVPITDSWNYVGTFNLDQPGFVGHVFEKENPSA